MSEAASPPDPSRAGPLARAGVVALGVIALALASLAFEAHGARLPLATLLLLAGEALGPDAPWTRRDAALRSGGFALLGAGALAPGAAGTVLLLLALALALRAFAASLARPGPRAPAPEEGDRASPRARLALGLLRAAATACVLLATAGRLAPERRVDLATLERRPLGGHDRLALLSRLTPFYAAEDACLLEDGVPLPHPEATHDAVAALGSGRSAIHAGRAIHFSSTDGTDPLAGSHRYELVYRPELFRSFPAHVLFGLTVVLGLLAWRARALASFATPSPRATRLALVLATVAAFTAGLPRHWDEITVVPDSTSYVRHAPIRPALYPAFVDLLDRQPLAPRVDVGRTVPGTPATPGQLRFLDVVRAQKLLTIAALAALVWTLSAHASAWIVGALAWLATLADLSAWLDESLARDAGTLESEGLHQPLLLLALAAALAYFARPRWATGVALALLLALLVLARPASLVLAIVLGFVALLHARRDGLKAAAIRAAPLALVFLAPLLVACGQNLDRYGRFRLHSFTGQNVFGTAFEVATPADLGAFPEPDLREVLRVCVEDLGARRIPREAGGEYVNVNAYEIGLPAVHRVVRTPPGESDAFVEDDVLLAIGKRLVLRHPRAFLGVVLWNASQGYSEVHALLLLAALVALALFWRWRDGRLLFAALAAALPLVALAPSCVFNYPLARYRSQLEPLELVAIPLLLTFAAARCREARARGTTSPAA